MNRYYAACVDDAGLIKSLQGPAETYDAAIGCHAYEHSLLSPRIVNGGVATPDVGQRRVLLDLGSVIPASERELQQLLIHDPVIRAIFELGRSRGLIEGRRP